jgi:hypothetical protein
VRIGFDVEVVVERDVRVGQRAKNPRKEYESKCTAPGPPKKTSKRPDESGRYEHGCFRRKKTLKGNGARGNSTVTGTYRGLARSNPPGRSIHENP